MSPVRKSNLLVVGIFCVAVAIFFEISKQMALRSFVQTVEMSAARDDFELFRIGLVYALGVFLFYSASQFVINKRTSVVFFAFLLLGFLPYAVFIWASQGATTAYSSVKISDAIQLPVVIILDLFYATKWARMPMALHVFVTSLKSEIPAWMYFQLLLGAFLGPVCLGSGINYLVQRKLGYNFLTAAQ
jgi:hypothetical protein